MIILSSILLALFTTIFIEGIFLILVLSSTIKIRKLVVFIIIINLLTNPLLNVLLLTGLRDYLLVLEGLVVLVEMFFMLAFLKVSWIKAFVLSFIMNFLSFMLGSPAIVYFMRLVTYPTA